MWLAKHKPSTQINVGAANRFISHALPELTPAQKAALKQVATNTRIMSALMLQHHLQAVSQLWHWYRLPRQPRTQMILPVHHAPAKGHHLPHKALARSRRRVEINPQPLLLWDLLQTLC